MAVTIAMFEIGTLFSNKQQTLCASNFDLIFFVEKEKNKFNKYRKELDQKTFPKIYKKSETT